MIRKIKIFIIGIAAAFTLNSCLDKFPDSAVPPGESMTTLDEANQLVLGIYSGFKSSALYSGYLTLFPDIQTDLVYAVEGYTNTYGNIWRWEILSDNTDIDAIYQALYTIIGRCNFFLDHVEDLRSTLVDDDDLTSLEGLEGEVYFARALAYSELIKCFCKAYDPATADAELGVALVSSYENPGYLTRASLKQSYQFVLDDLEKADEYLDFEETNNQPYFTNSLVNALYARIYLYMQEWQLAIDYATKVIDDPYLNLSSASTTYVSGYTYFQYMWKYDAATEIIWKVGFTGTSYGGALGKVFLNWVGTSTYTPDYVPASWVVNGLYGTNDQRKGAYFTTITTSYSHALSWPLLTKYMGNESFISTYNIRHVSMPKPFRLAEQYLIRAEAYCRLENYSKGASDLTTLRTARYTTYGSTTLSASTWLDEISNERVRELYMEGFRLHDLKRWGRGFERTPQQSSVEAGSSLKIDADNPLFVWPIPQHEIDSPDSDIQPNESNGI